MDENTRIEILENEMKSMRETITELKKEVNDNKQDMTELKCDLKVLTSSMGEFKMSTKEMLTEIKTELAKINNKPNELIDKVKVSAVTIIVTTIIGAILALILI